MFAEIIIKIMWSTFFYFFSETPCINGWYCLVREVEWG